MFTLKTMRKRRQQPAQHAQRNQESGFTIVETAIAMVIMMIAALASVSLFAYSIKYNSGATDRELAMAVAQKQMEQLRNATFLDPSLDATVTAGVTSTVTSANRNYTVVKQITNSNLVDGSPTMKIITITVTPTGTPLGSVTLRTLRSATITGPY
jgi:Tfp pilus assembly protein PilV